MIGSLRGIVDLRNDPYLLVDVSGVGYKVLVSNEVLSKVDGLGGQIKLFIHTHVREDSLDLYGFSSLEDLRLFELLIGVSGVGPKTAMGIFSSKNRSDIINAITSGDVDFFTSVPRLGKKNAQKIIIELKNKFGSIQELDLSENSIRQNYEVAQALKSLGFSIGEAEEAIKNIKDEGKSTEEKMKQALKYLSK